MGRPYRSTGGTHTSKKGEKRLYRYTDWTYASTRAVEKRKIVSGGGGKGVQATTCYRTGHAKGSLYGRFSVHCSGITLENEPFCRAVYTNPFLETFFFVHIGSVQIQAPSVGTTITNRRKTI